MKTTNVTTFDYFSLFARSLSHDDIFVTCPKCANKKVVIDLNTQEQFMSEKNMKLLYVGGATRVSCLCEICDHEFYKNMVVKSINLQIEIQ